MGFCWTLCPILDVIRNRESPFDSIKNDTSFGGWEVLQKSEKYYKKLDT